MNCDCIFIIKNEAERNDMERMRKAADFINGQLNECELFADHIMVSNIEATMYELIRDDMEVVITGKNKKVGKLHKGDKFLLVSGKYHDMVGALRVLSKQEAFAIHGFIVGFAPDCYGKDDAIEVIEDIEEPKIYIEVVNDRSETERGIELEDGRIVNVYRKDGSIHRFDQYFDLVTGELFPLGEHPECAVCFNELREAGKAKEVYCYDECRYDFSEDAYIGSEESIKQVQAYFKEYGYKVTLKALRYCLCNKHKYHADYGYRDDKNGYYLFFSWEACDPHHITLMTLHDLCKNWQQTHHC